MAATRPRWRTPGSCGMPEAVEERVDHGDLNGVRVHRRLRKHTDKISPSTVAGTRSSTSISSSANCPRLLGRKVVFGYLPGNRRRRDLQPALALLAKAGRGSPRLALGIYRPPLAPKSIRHPLQGDLHGRGVAESILGFDGDHWIWIDGDVRECRRTRGRFVGQELIAYGQRHNRPLGGTTGIREARSSNAEVDYVHPAGARVIPVEVKHGTSGWLRSLRIFLESRVGHLPGHRCSLFTCITPPSGPTCRATPHSMPWILCGADRPGGPPSDPVARLKSVLSPRRQREPRPAAFTLPGTCNPGERTPRPRRWGSPVRRTGSAHRTTISGPDWRAPFTGQRPSAYGGELQSPHHDQSPRLASSIHLG